MNIYIYEWENHLHFIMIRKWDLGIEYLETMVLCGMNSLIWDHTAGVYYYCYYYCYYSELF